jgi:hypothetical protein
MLFKEIIDIYCENHTKPISALCGNNAEWVVVAGGAYNYHWALKG